MQKIIALTNRIFGSSEDAVITTKYTRSVDTSGWLKVKLEPSGGFAFLCEYTKVLVQRSSGGRTYFLINEGVYANKTASVTDTNASKCLISYTRGTGATLNIKIIGRSYERSPIRNQFLNQLFAELSFNGKKVRITLDSDIHFEVFNFTHTFSSLYFI